LARKIATPHRTDGPYVDGEQPCLIEQNGPAALEPVAAATLDALNIFNAVGEVPYDWRIDTDRIVWGPNVREVLKIRDLGALASGRAFARLVDSASETTRFDAVLKSTLRDEGAGVPYQVQYCLRPSARGHSKLWVEDTGRWFADADGRPAHAQGVVRMINERYEHEQRLNYLSRFDGLTGELNRGHLTEFLGDTLEEAMRFRSSCGFLLVAIDNLARINEAYGYDVADEVLAAAGKRIRAKMRGGDCLGRYSGNKFGIVLKKCTPEEMIVAAERLLTGVRDDVIHTSGGSVAVTITIGGVTAPRHARSTEEILARAQESLDIAKAKRRGSFLAYRPNPEREALRRENVRATDEIITALNERRIFLAYEPVVAAQSRRPAFYECLMRIRRADGQRLLAQAVVPIAERLGLVRLLDHRVMELVVEELVAAPELHASLNVSPASTTDPDWWAGLGALLRAHPTVAGRLTVEITEMAAIQDVDDTRGFVTRVKDLGCRIAIDDFGAGYTSFRNLRKLGVDMVKIDGAFVQNLMQSADDRAFVHTLIDLARRLGLATVAEWVQDEDTAEMLAGWGCDYMQGALAGLASNDRPWAPSASESGEGNSPRPRAHRRRRPPA
jgi:diguanylate cyclase (GGDEF)-like protein